MGFHAIIFDMDGVLVDSEPLGFRAMRQVMARHGVTYTEADNNEFLGRTTLEECRILKSRHGLEADARALTSEYVEILVGLIRDQPRPMPGVPGVLDELRAAGYRMALASSADPLVIAENVRSLGLARLFEAVVSGTEVARGKPAPDVFVETARRLGVRPDSCLVVEDSRNGLLAAKAAQMACAVIPCASTRHQTFQEADYCLRTLAELRALL
ncbi:MAG TPA: HAD family phosphatase [Candidatus Methylomirabilis sp.]|nr:HAD family phosphatase [Candidatus Methylomirabilis sp.]